MSRLVAGRAALVLFTLAGLASALPSRAGAAVATPLVSVSTSQSAGTVVGDGTVLSVTFNATPALASSYSLTLTDGAGVGALSSAAGDLSASVSGNRIDFTVHGGPAMSVGSSLSLTVLEILAATGVTDAAGNPWNLVASGQVDKPDRSTTCTNIVGYTRVFGGSNCSIGFAKPGPLAPEVFDVIPVATTDLPGPPDDSAPEVITQCQTGASDVVYDVNTGVQLGAKACGVATNPPEQLIGNTNSNTLDYIATPGLVSFEEVGVVETIPGSSYVSASAVPPQLSGITVSGTRATLSYYGSVACQASDRDRKTISQFSYEAPSTNLKRSGLVYAAAIACPPHGGGTSLTVTFPRPLPLGALVRFKYAGYGPRHYIVGAASSPFALEREASESAAVMVPATPPAGGTGPSKAPNTRLVTEQISSSAHEAKFRFVATGPATGFQCALALVPTVAGAKWPPHPYSACVSPKTFKGLASGSYALWVRAFGPGGVDHSPATYRFVIT
jgi:hypothetical protein